MHTPSRYSQWKFDLVFGNYTRDVQRTPRPTTAPTTARKNKVGRARPRTPKDPPLVTQRSRERNKDHGEKRSILSKCHKVTSPYGNLYPVKCKFLLMEKKKAEARGSSIYTRRVCEVCWFVRV